MSLLKCSFCKSSLNTYGKTGAIIQTNCLNCGMNSSTMTSSIAPPNKKFVEIIRLRKKDPYICQTVNK